MTHPYPWVKWYALLIFSGIILFQRAIREIDMASLQDQLLKAGLVDEKKAKKAKKDKRKQNKVAHKSKEQLVDETKLAAQQAKAEKAEKDRELNRQRQQEAEQKAFAAQVKQLIQVNKIDKGKADIGYNFEHAGKFKKIYVNAELQNLLSRGRLAIVAFSEADETVFEVVPVPVAEKIAQRDESSVILINNKEDTSTTITSEEEDWYADYEIPDDLMW